MSKLLCCRAGRRSSPDLPNARLVSSGGDKSQSLLHNSHVPRKTRTDESAQSENIHELQRIFASSQDQSEHASSPRKRLGYTSESLRSKLLARASTSHLRNVIRERMSRDSMFSVRSRKKLRSAVGEEEIERRKELKRALHQRLRDELLADRSASQGGYDVDAKVIATPTITKSRSGGALQMSPKELSGLMRRLESSQSDSKLRDFYQVSKGARDAHAKVSSNYDHANASKVTSVWEDDVPDSEIPPQYAIDEIKQIFKAPRKGSVEIVDMDRRSHDNPAQAPSLRTETVIQAPKTEALLKKHHRTASYASVQEEPVSPDLLPLRMPSITESAHDKWRLSASSRRYGSARIRSHAMKEEPATMNSSKPVHLLYPKGWHQDPPALLGPQTRSRPPESGDVDKKIHPVVHTRECDPASEESNFGGVDGVAGYDGSNSNAEDQKEQNEDQVRADPLNDYKTETTQLSPSKVLATAMSLPQLPNMARRDRSRSSGTHSTAYSMNERSLRYSSSSSYIVPDHKRASYRGDVSSVYTCADGSIMSTSPQSSLTRLGNLSDRLKLLRAPDYGVLPYYYRNGSVDISSTNLAKDLRAARRRTIDTTSFQSSTDSFRAQEIAAAEVRIVPKARPLEKAKASRFKEELGDEKSKPASIREKDILDENISKRSSLRSYDGSEEWYSTGVRQGYGFAFVPEEDETTVATLWERALKDHAHEVASTPPKKPGSLSHVFSSLSMRNRASHSQLKPRASRQLSRVELPDTIKHGDIGPLIVVTPVKTQFRQPKTAAAPPSWTKFPSHTRAQRSDSPAGEADQVFSRDFASQLAHDSPMSTKSRRSILNRRKKSRSMSFSKQMFKSWSLLYKSQSSSNVNAHARGIRSSISDSGFQAHKKREMRPVDSPKPVPTPKRAMRPPVSPKPSPLAQREVAKILFPMSEANESTATTEGDDVYTNDRSAKAWSKLYEDCVKHPRETETEAGSVMNASASYLHPSSASRRTASRSSQAASTGSGGEMRESTLDFQRALRMREVEAQKKALEIAKGV
ncbi:hypothetical protein MMC13_005290 [Lambiella insularis]|nr:hypothetical protein [Lambiella insularis]